MGGDHKCPVCGSTFTRSQHVARHMRSHTGDRPYKCVHCGDQFARSDLLSRHVNKCHTNEKKTSPPNANARRKGRQPSIPSGTTANTMNTSQIDPAGLVPGTLLGGIGGSLASGPLFGNGALNPYNPRFGTTNVNNPTDIYPSSTAMYSHSPVSSARRYSLTHSIGEGVEIPSLSSSSSASASLDSLPHEPIFQLPPNQHTYTQSYHMDGLNRAYLPQQSQQQHQQQQQQQQQHQSHFGPYQSTYDPNVPAPDGMQLKQDPGPSSLYPSAFHSSSMTYNDLPTPLAYPGSHYRGGMDPFGPPPVANPSDPPSHPSNQLHQSHTQPQPPLNPQQAQAQTRYIFSQNSTALGLGRGEGGFSSAFGLMTLDDAAVLAGISNDGVPFFDHTGMGGHDLNDLSLHPPVQTPNTREKEITALREMWAAFMKDPTTGLRPDGTEMPRPEFPVPGLGTSTGVDGNASATGSKDTGAAQGQLHRRASSYGGSTDPRAGEMYPAPHMPMAQQTLQGANIVKKLEDQASRTDVASQGQNGGQVANRIVSATSGDDLRSYEEAILARKAPVLKMPTKVKGRDASSSMAPASAGAGPSTNTVSSLSSAMGAGNAPAPLPHSASGVLPPLSAFSSILPPPGAGSRSGAPQVGGSVGSLLQNTQALPTAAGASGVPVGSTPNTAMQGLTQSHMHASMASGNPDRPVIAMPRSRSRSRPSTASGTAPGTGTGGPPTRPPSATMGISIGPNGMIINHLPNSQPPSRPGTASSSASGAAPMSHPHQFGVQTSPPQAGVYPHPQSQPGSRPSTSQAFGPNSTVPNSAMSPSFAFMPPPPAHPPPPPPPGQIPAFHGSLPVEAGLHLHMANAANAPPMGASVGGLLAESPITGSNRPAYKRNASQVLEPASNKRPHYRRGDTNFKPTASSPHANGSGTNAMEEDGFDSDVSLGGSEYGGVHGYYRSACHSPSGRPGSATTANFGMNGVGNLHSPMSPGRVQNGDGTPGFAARRMSEPAVVAPRMVMRRLPPNTQVVAAGAGSGNPSN